MGALVLWPQLTSEGSVWFVSWVSNWSWYVKWNVLKLTLLWCGWNVQIGIRQITGKLQCLRLTPHTFKNIEFIQKIYVVTSLSWTWYILNKRVKIFQLCHRSIVNGINGTQWQYGLCIKLRSRLRIYDTCYMPPVFLSVYTRIGHYLY